MDVLDPDTCYRAVASRDPRFDGRFYTAVLTTHIYCRPSCPARTPLRRNVRFYVQPAAAERAGFRACRRCRPDLAPDAPDVDVRGDLVGRALRLIADGTVESDGVSGLAGRLAVSERHLHRTLVAEFGTGPLEIARSRRVRLARALLEESDLPASDVAFAAGFGSIRQFNDAVHRLTGLTPSALRARPGRGRGRSGLVLRLAYRSPYEPAATLRFLAARAIPGVEQVTAGVWRRTVDGGVVVVEPSPGAVLLRLDVADSRTLGPVTRRVRRVLDLDADPATVAMSLGLDPVLGPLVRAHPGLRCPGSWSGFEGAVRAVLGQQVSIAAARTLAGRLAARCGEALPFPVGTLTHRFPTAAAVAEADLDGLGLTGRRTATLRALAAEVASGRIELDGAELAADVLARLCALPGVGAWTAAYIGLRVLRDPDAFPDTDLGLRAAAQRLHITDLAGAAERWRPWRAYAATHLWETIT